VTMQKKTILRVNNLRTHFLREPRPPVKAVDGISYSVAAGEMVAIVGESGCGKSVGVLSLMRLNPPTSTIVGGEVLWHDQNLLKMSKDHVRQIRGKDIAMIFQNPLSSLNPIMRIGNQLSEVMEIHRGISRKDGWSEGTEMLKAVGIPDVTSKMEAYPFELSGGMRQRVMIAMALCCKPELLIADEPTTALDATTQAQILELMASANRDAGRATILVTHDLGIVARYVDRVYIMYAGHIVEVANCVELYEKPLHPYTLALLKAMPRLDLARQYKLVPIEGYPPRLDRLTGGCPFYPRCKRKIDRCKDENPSLEEVAPDRLVACWLHRK
jgi:oligopeptide transport system ATP-binding protein